MWKLLLQPGKNLAQRAAHSAGSLRAAAGHNRRSKRLRIRSGDILGDENQRPDEPELAIAGMRHWRQRAELSREHSVAQQRLAELVRRVAEGDHVGSQAARNLVHRPSPVAAAKIATVVRLVFEQSQRRLVAEVGPG